MSSVAGFPISSAASLGMVQIGAGIAISASGVISAALGGVGFGLTAVGGVVSVTNETTLVTLGANFAMPIANTQETILQLAGLAAGTYDFDAMLMAAATSALFVAAGVLDGAGAVQASAQMEVGAGWSITTTLAGQAVVGAGQAITLVAVTTALPATIVAHGSSIPGPSTLLRIRRVA